MYSLTIMSVQAIDLGQLIIYSGTLTDAEVELAQSVSEIYLTLCSLAGKFYKLRKCRKNSNFQCHLVSAHIYV